MEIVPIVEIRGIFWEEDEAYLAVERPDGRLFFATLKKCLKDIGKIEVRG